MELRAECPEGARHVNEDLGKGRSAGQSSQGRGWVAELNGTGGWRAPVTAGEAGRARTPGPWGRDGKVWLMGATGGGYAEKEGAEKEGTR